MTVPWIKRKAGELLTSAAWNDMQSQARQELLATQELLSATLASFRDRLNPAGERQDCRVSVGYPEGNQNFKLPISLPTRSIVILQADGYAVANQSAYINPVLELLFILHQGSKQAPARLMPLDTASEYAKGWPGEPNADRWPQWLEYHNNYFKKSASWPRTGLNHATGLGENNTFNIAVCLEECVELPPGEYGVQLALVATSYTSFNPRCLRAITIPR